MNRGFTLVELLLAILLGAMIMLSFAAIYANSYKWFRTVVQGNMHQTGMISSTQAMMRDVEKTTYLFRPATPCPFGSCPNAAAPQTSDILEGCTNFDAATGSQMDATKNMRIYNYCVDNATGILWYTWNDNAALGTCQSVPFVACGTALPGGQVVQLAQQVIRSPFRSVNCANVTNHYFCRPGFGNNSLEIDMVVAGSTISTTVGTSNAVLWPGP